MQTGINVTLVTVGTDTFTATITASTERDGYTLAWHDGVVNEWHETFPTFPLALMRLALLDHVAAHSDHQGWTTTEQEFATVATVFLKGQTV